MGLRFRKSIKLTPAVKLNLGKKSASVSVGVKGAHITKSTTGRTTASVGLPGTGLSYSVSSGTKKRKAKDSSGKKAKAPGCLTSIIIFIIFILIIGGIGSCANSDKNETSASYVESSSDETLTTTSEETASIAEQTSADTPATSIDAVFSDDTTEEKQITYVLNTSSHKIHTSTCNDISKISSENYSEWNGSSVEEFLALYPEYSTCGHCHPQ